MSSQSEDLKSPSNTRGINTDQGFCPQLLHLIQIHDTAFPTGSFGHSFGMETFIQDGALTTSDELLEFCAMYLRHSLGSLDGIIVKEAYRLAKTRDVAALIRLEELCQGVKLSSESRAGSAMLGRQFLNAVRPLSDDGLLAIWQEKMRRQEIAGHYPLVYGIYTAALNTDPVLAVETFLYSSVAALVQNAVRAIPLGPRSGVKVIFSLLPTIHEVARSIESRDLDSISNESVALEIASIRHAFLGSRLFMS